MSTPEEVEVKCPKCGKVFHTTQFDSITSDWPNAAQLIISRDLWKITCPKCAASSYNEHPLMYTDKKRNFWIQSWDNPVGYSIMAKSFKKMRGNMGAQFRIVKDSVHMAQKVLALENGRDDRIIEIYKRRWQIEILDKYPGFNRMEPYYSMNEGKETLLFANAKREILFYDFYDKIYDMIADSFLPILEGYEAPNCVYDYAWAGAFIEEYERYAPWHNPD